MSKLVLATVPFSQVSGKPRVDLYTTARETYRYCGSDKHNGRYYRNVQDMAAGMNLEESPYIEIVDLLPLLTLESRVAFDAEDDREGVGSNPPDVR